VDDDDDETVKESAKERPSKQRARRQLLASVNVGEWWTDRKAKKKANRDRREEGAVNNWSQGALRS
jgi:hypothetical protein